MVQSQFSVSWDSYNSNICKGFSALQQNGEFVDMTLAADGFYVKVHQVLIALASPFLKELISTAPCPHPVVFLNNISHQTLSALLEYIYTGEVLVASDNLASFAEAAKSLHIKGLENFIDNEDLMVNMLENSSQMENSELCHVSGIKRMGVPVNQRVEQIGLPAAARKIRIKQEPKLTSTRQFSNQNISSTDTRDQDFDDPMDDVVFDNADDDDNDQNESIIKDKNNSNITYKPTSNLQFTVSIRGSLQIILNRYIYNMHSITHRSGVRRWRCVDYRNNKCMAFVVTKGNVVLNRANLHNHSFHDKKILAKIEKKCVYSALDDVQGYKERDEKETEGQEFMSLEELTDSDLGDKTNDFIKET